MGLYLQNVSRFQETGAAYFTIPPNTFVVRWFGSAYYLRSYPVVHLPHAAHSLSRLFGNYEFSASIGIPISRLYLHLSAAEKSTA